MQFVRGKTPANVWLGTRTKTHICLTFDHFTPPGDGKAAAAIAFRHLVCTVSVYKLPSVMRSVGAAGWRFHHAARRCVTGLVLRFFINPHVQITCSAAVACIQKRRRRHRCRSCRQTQFGCICRATADVAAPAWLRVAASSRQHSNTQIRSAAAEVAPSAAEEQRHGLAAGADEEPTAVYVHLPFCKVCHTAPCAL